MLFSTTCRCSACRVPWETRKDFPYKARGGERGLRFRRRISNSLLKGACNYVEGLFPRLQKNSLNEETPARIQGGSVAGVVSLLRVTPQEIFGYPDRGLVFFGSAAKIRRAQGAQVVWRGRWGGGGFIWGGVGVSSCSMLMNGGNTTPLCLHRKNRGTRTG